MSYLCKLKATFVAFLLMTIPVQAQTIRLVAASAAGSGNDVTARIFAEALSIELNRPVIVENKPGGSGLIAAEAVANGDENTILWGSSLVVSPIAWKVTRYLQPIGSAASTPLTLCTTSKWHTLDEFIAAGKAKALTFATPGYGSPSHYASVSIIGKYGMLPQLMIPFRGSPQAVAEVIAGRVDSVFIPAHIARGLDLTVMSNVQFADWYGLFAAPRITVIPYEQALSHIIASPDFKEKVEKIGGKVAPPMTIVEFNEMVRTTADLYERTPLAP